MVINNDSLYKHLVLKGFLIKHFHNVNCSVRDTCYMILKDT